MSSPDPMPTAAPDEELERAPRRLVQRELHQALRRVMKRSSPGECQGCKVNDPKGI